MSTDQIIEAAKRIRDFDKLPVTAQISLLYAEITAARKHRLPLSTICSALNEAGSKVTLRYLRQALSVVRQRHKDEPLPTPSSHPAAGIAKHVSPAKPQQVSGEVELTAQTPKEAREQKAESYVSGTQSNPLLQRQRETQKGKE